MTKKRQRRPRATQAETDRRIRTVFLLLREGRRKCEIKRLIKRRFKVGPRQAETLLSRARSIFRYQLGKSAEDLRLESFLFYQRILVDPDVSTELKLVARTRLDRLFGLEQPRGNPHARWQRKIREAGLDPATFTEAMQDILRRQTERSRN